MLHSLNPRFTLRCLTVSVRLTCCLYEKALFLMRRESEVEVQLVLEVGTGNDTVEGEDVDKRGGFIKADVRGVCCGKGE